ncbi:MAG: hypothetical protein WD603_02225 [Patescibacteria group bacterium]
MNGDPTQEQQKRRERARQLYQVVSRSVPKDRFERTTELIDGLGLIGRMLAAALIAIVALVLILGGHLLLVVQLGGGLAAFFLLSRNRIRAAAVPLAVLGIFGILGWFSGIAEGGVTGDMERGFVVGGLALLTILFGLMYLAKRDTVSLIGTLVFLGAAMLANLFLGLEFIGTVAEAAAAALAILGILAVLLVWLFGFLPGMTVSAIIIGTYLASWLLFGDIEGRSGIGLTIWKDGRFDQAGYGIALLLLAAVFAFSRSAQRIPSDDDDEGQQPEEGYQPASEQESAFLEHLRDDDEFMEAWQKLTPAARELVVEELWPQIKQGRLFDLNKDRILKKAFDDMEVSQKEVDETGAGISELVWILQRQFIATAVSTGIARKTGVIPLKRLKSITDNDKIMEELLVTPELVKEEITRQEARKQQENDDADNGS